MTVGTEILLGEIINTNSSYLARELASLGVDVYRQTSVGDNLTRATQAVREGLSRADLVITTGGLGPTDDDLTREAVCAALDIPLILDEQQLRVVEAHFAGRRQAMPPNNIKQAMIPQGAVILPNPNGTACGSAVVVGEKMVMMLPGPPFELEPMFVNHGVPWLRRVYGLRDVLVTRTLRFFAIGESRLETELMDLLRAQSDPTMALYAKTGEVELRLATKASSTVEADLRFAPVERMILDRLGYHVYGYGEDSLETVVAALLLKRSVTVTTAESCTGGLIAHKLTNVPGSSAYFDRGFVTYSNEAKQGELEVDAQVIEEYGAVSAECVRAMAEGARRVTGSDLALAVSGVAGPGGGTEAKPVGLVFIALASANAVQVIRLQLSGSRQRIKEFSSKHALFMLYCFLTGRTLVSTGNMTVVQSS